jgi:hypothetical protein
MKTHTYPRLIVLVVTGVLMAMLWMAIGTGCDGTSTPPDKDEVRRRSAVAKAGSPASNPPTLTDTAWKDLNAGDAVRTDSNGEAELRLVGCDGSVWVFDNSTLSVWPCNKQAEANNESWCNEEGTAAFNIKCTARFEVIGTPSAQVRIKSTAFTVTFLPETQLTLITALSGVVEVTPVVNLDAQEFAEPVPLKAGYFLYTMPGGQSPEIARIEARTAQPLYKLPVLVYELGIRDWFDDITRWGDMEQLLEPTWPFLGVTLDFGGGQLDDPRVQEAFVTAINQDAVLGQAFPDQEVGLTAVIGGEPRDALTIAYDPDRALALLKEAGYEYGQLVTIIFPGDDDQRATAAKLIAGDLSRIDIEIELNPFPAAELPAVMEEFARGGVPVLAIYP